MRESVEQRHERILQIVRGHGSMRVTELAAEVGSSLETIRRDVIALAEVGRLRRLHGKVSWPTATLNARDARLARRAPAAASGPLLGMVVPVAGYFYQGVIQGARAAAAAAGTRLLVGITEYSSERFAQQVANMVRAGADGLLLTPSWEPGGPTGTECEELTRLQVPAVLLERRVPVGSPGTELDRVGSDHAEGAAMAVRHLAGLGHRRIALLLRASHTEPALRLGYAAAMRALDLPEDDLRGKAAPVGAGRTESFEEELPRLLALIQSGEVRAALVHTDTDAVNLLQRLAAEGIRVPQDFALVSYDAELAAVADVPLTAVAPLKHAVGEAAANQLLLRIADPARQRTHIELLPELKVRDSCGAALVAARPSSVD